MLSFENDYSCTATPEIIERISEIAQNQYPGYGNDSICESAKAKIREACACPDAQIFFLVGGTQTNQTIIDSITPQYAGVIAASTGHVNVHEAGAIEFTGHKVLTLPHHDGKIDATELDEYCATFYADGNYTHMVFPGCVYISQATEYGTLYTLAELEAMLAAQGQYLGVQVVGGHGVCSLQLSAAVARPGGGAVRGPQAGPSATAQAVALTGGNAHGAGVVVAVVRIAHGTPGGGVGYWCWVGQQVQQLGFVGAQAFGPHANHCLIATNAQVFTIGGYMQSSL